MSIQYDFKKKGDRIQFALDQSQHTPSSVAYKIGCKPQAIYQWINGTTKNIKNELLFKFSDLTGLSPRWIATGEGTQHPVDRPGSQAITNTILTMQAMAPEQQYLVARLADQVSKTKLKEDDDA